jgi:heavy metal translocating P-type ATPase
LTRLGLAIFFTMNVMAFTMALWTTDVYPIEGTGQAGLIATFHGLFRHVVLLCAMPVLFLLGWPFWENAVAEVRRGVFSTDLLLGTGVAASFAYSTVSVMRGAGPVYFEVGCVVLVMVTLGRWLEATGKLKASDALDRLSRLMPQRVRRGRDGMEEELDRSAIVAGDMLRVLEGERIPADSRIYRGQAFVDEQVLTGESTPALRQAGDAVLGGTLNLDGDLLVEVTSAGPEGTLARLIELVRQAREAKGRYGRLADRISAWFVPGVTVVALVTFVAHGLWSGWERGLLQALAVVLIACPCALGLATPLAVWSALGRAAGAQVLFRSGDALERLSEVRAVRFDKTGTLTTGTPAVTTLTCEAGADRDEVILRAALLAQASSHVLARAIVRSLGRAAAGLAGTATDTRTCAGRGIMARVEIGSSAPLTFLGSRRLLEENGLGVRPVLDEAARLSEAAGRSIALIGWGGSAQGLFTFEERLRPSARAAIARCRGLGLDVGVLTGDHAARGAALASELGITVAAELLPEAKVAAIAHARACFGPVAMVGDGVNDAPALASSDVGVALGCGSDLSRESAAVCLLGDDLDRLPWAIALARQTRGVIRANLAWAFGYNSLGVACAAVGWLNPALAAFLMVASSAFVIVNSLRLGDANPADPENHFPLDAGEMSSSVAAEVNTLLAPIPEALAR